MSQSQYDSKDDAFFAAVGRLALGWGMIDSCLEVMCLIIFNDFGGRKIEDEIPWSLSRKIKFLRRCFSTIELFKPVAPILLPLLVKAAAGMEKRHDVVHGVLLSSPEPGLPTQMGRFLRSLRAPYDHRFAITTDEILRDALAANDLGGRLLNLALALGQIVSSRAQKGD
jgi:hypothetical protein